MRVSAGDLICVAAGADAKASPRPLIQLVLEHSLGLLFEGGVTANKKSAFDQDPLPDQIVKPPKPVTISRYLGVSVDLRTLLTYLYEICCLLCLSSV